MQQSPPEYFHFVAQGEQLDLLGLFATKEEESQSEELSDSEVDEGPQLATGRVLSHRDEGSRTIFVLQSPWWGA
jgi:hypothetical protein